MSKKQIAVSILHHKKARLTVDCLNSLRQQSFDDFHVYLLMQGASAEDAITLHNLFDDWRQLTINEIPDNLGFAEGNNINIRQAIAECQPEFIVTLNNDTTVNHDFLQKLTAPFVDQHIGLVQAVMMKMSDPRQIDSLGIEFLKSGLTFNIKNYNKKLFCPTAGAAAYRRELLERTRQEKQVYQGFESRITYDYFDSAFFAYAEDFDLGFRALHAGFRPALATEAVCRHIGSATTSSMSDFAVFHTYRNLVWALYKNLPLWLMLSYSPFLVAAKCMLLVNFAKKRQLSVFVSALLESTKKIRQFSPTRKHILANSRITTQQLKEFITPELVDRDYI